MLLILVLILLLLWSSVVWSIYSSFLVFYSNFFESENYHKAYYASISALERWELVTKQRQPWYAWSGWFDTQGIWKWGNPAYHDWWSDRSLSWFSYLWNTENETSVFRTVNSKTTRIPENWKWDIEWTLAYENPGNPNTPDNSNNYNKMDYENAEIFLLYYDKSEGDPYKKASDSDLRKSDIQQITWEIRLPKLLKDSNFWLLNTGRNLVWQQGSLPNDDSIVDRQIRWEYLTWGNYIPYTIYSTQVIYLDSEGDPGRKVTYDKDNVFRERYINENLTFNFWNTSKRSPITNNEWTNVGNSVVPTIISQSENEILSLLQHEKFKSAFTSSYFYKPQLRFSLLNLLQWNNNLVYPFLEYYADFWTIVPDKYYTINGEWNFKDYQINTIIQKPTVKETILWNFTSIFW